MTTPTPAPAPMTAERLDQCAWLIECRIGPESTYVQLKSREELSQKWEEEIHARGHDAAKKLKPWHFTKDASSATRFAREEDAARAMVALGMQGPTGLLDWLRPTEHMWSDAAHPDVSNVPALTARVAELEQRARSAEERMRLYREQSITANGLVGKLESELAAARKVETDDLTVARMRKTFSEAATKIGASREQLLKDTQAEVERLSAALKAANDRADKEEDLRKGSDEAADELVTAWKRRAQAAEAKLAVFETHVKGMLAEAYRAGWDVTDSNGRGPDVCQEDYANRTIAQLKEPRHD